MKKVLLLFVVVQFLTMKLEAQVTTYFYGKDKVDSKNWTAVPNLPHRISFRLY